MRLMAGLFRLVFLFAVLLASGIIAGWIWLQNEVESEGPATGQVTFQVSAGEALSSVAFRLETDGLVRDARVIRLKARLDNTATAIKAGTYVIPARATPASILNQFVEGDVVQLKLTIPEGLTTTQILNRVEASDLLSGDMPETEYAEGALLPDTYVFDMGTSRTKFINRMVKAQTKLLEDLWADRQDGLPISTPQEAVILASVVEKETGKAEERDLVAGLFVGRLKRGMRLESDPTIIYGVSGGEPLLNKKGERRTLYRSEIRRKTDWNTYQIDGLPKTPICNPGREAIAAVLNPPETDYVFFVADGTGGHKFAKTLAEHNRNVAAYRAFEKREIARERSN